jgi:hypothetical protein
VLVTLNLKFYAQQQGNVGTGYDWEVGDAEIVIAANSYNLQKVTANHEKKQLQIFSYDKFEQD